MTTLLNKKIRHYTLIMLAMVFVFSNQLSAQNEKVAVSGYVKNMQTVLFFNDSYPTLQPGVFKDTVFLDELIHQRLNLNWYINDKFTFKAGWRNRIFLGDLVKSDPNYGKQIDDSSNDYIDLSALVIDKPSVVWHSVLDRLYLEYSSGDWEVRVGRQRVNWGINTVWNPNDVFNAFSFTDFDYEERPGSDAIRVKYYTSFASSIEIAAKAADNIEEAVIAGLWKFNKWEYDFQLLAGYVKEDLVFGGGWAGNIKNAGFKGEFSWFTPLEDTMEESAFAATIGVDYSFANSLYLTGGALYNSMGISKGDASTLFSFELSAKNLYPYQWAFFGQASFPFTPLLNGGLAVIYSPVESQALFLNPTLGVSIKENWDIDLVGQIIFDKQEQYGSSLQAAFLRLKYSY
jgi:hypothetical protein